MSSIPPPPPPLATTLDKVGPLEQTCYGQFLKRKANHDDDDDEKDDDHRLIDKVNGHEEETDYEMFHRCIKNEILDTCVKKASTSKYSFPSK